MSYTPWGKHVSIDQDHPQAVGICDYSGSVFMRKDLVRQMEWRGNDLVWTGFYVGRPYVDMPNEQAKSPILPPDPIPIKDPRPPFQTFITWSEDSNVFSQDGSTFGSQPGIMLDAPALPFNQRLYSLQTVNWSMG